MYQQNSKNNSNMFKEVTAWWWWHISARWCISHTNINLIQSGTPPLGRTPSQSSSASSISTASKFLPKAGSSFESSDPIPSANQFQAGLPYDYSRSFHPVKQFLAGSSNDYSRPFPSVNPYQAGPSYGLASQASMSSTGRECYDLESNVTNQTLNSVLSEMRGMMKIVTEHHKLQEHLADIKREKEQESSLKPFSIEEFFARTESDEFLMSVEANLSSFAPSLKPIRCSFSLLLYYSSLYKFIHPVLNL